MHDPSVDLHWRMCAAEELCQLGYADVGVVRVHKIIIETGYIPTAEETREVALLHRIWASGQTLTSLGYFDTDMQTGTILADLEVKGHA